MERNRTNKLKPLPKEWLEPELKKVAHSTSSSKKVFRVNGGLYKKRIAVFFILLFLGVVFSNFLYFQKQVRSVVSGQKEIYSTENYNLAQTKILNTPNFLKIESLNITAPILFATSSKETEVQKLLESGVVHYVGTADIGENGNAYIFGHSSDFILSAGQFKTVFALLPQIKLGAEIYASNGAGQLFIYKVIESKEVRADDISVLDQFQNKRKLLSLQTSYPVGTALARWIVVAEIK